MRDPHATKTPPPEPGAWTSQEAPNRPGPPFDEPSRDREAFDPDATATDLPPARRRPSGLSS